MNGESRVRGFLGESAWPGHTARVRAPDEGEVANSPDQVPIPEVENPVHPNSWRPDRVPNTSPETFQTFIFKIQAYRKIKTTNLF